MGRMSAQHCSGVNGHVHLMQSQWGARGAANETPRMWGVGHAHFGRQTVAPRRISGEAVITATAARRVGCCVMSLSGFFGEIVDWRGI